MMGGQIFVKRLVRGRSSGRDVQKERIAYAMLSRKKMSSSLMTVQEMETNETTKKAKAKAKGGIEAEKAGYRTRMENLFFLPPGSLIARTMFDPDFLFSPSFPPFARRLLLQEQEGTKREGHIQHMGWYTF